MIVLHLTYTFADSAFIKLFLNSDFSPSSVPIGTKSDLAGLASVCDEDTWGMHKAMTRMVEGQRWKDKCTVQQKLTVRMMVREGGYISFILL